MHVVDLLYSDMFEIEAGGRIISQDELLPGWNEHDRFGIVIDSPLGGLGATHLIQVAITMFYDSKPVRRTERKIYPDIYAIHIGRDYGAHGPFDFWPARREIIVSEDHREILDAINDRGITRLAVPDRPVRDIVHRPKEVDAALDRIVTAVIYNETGRVENPDFSITGTSSKSELNPRSVIRPITVTEDMVQQLTMSGRQLKEVDPDYGAMLIRRQDAVDKNDRQRAAERRVSNKSGAGVKETYRFSDIAECLHRL